jgi:hydroxymethylpyrimidine/phosphomethylpyrimidine kinase
MREEVRGEGVRLSTNEKGKMAMKRGKRESRKRNPNDEMGKIPRVLTVAGSDSGGGAGIQADLKTFTALGVFGMSAITCVTAQNTLGVKGVHDLPPDFVALQIRVVAEDIGVDAVKTGMLRTERTVRVVAETLRSLKLVPVVVDPVLRAKDGRALMERAAVNVLARQILPLSEVVTPNRWEAEALAGMAVNDLKGAREAARRIADGGSKWVIIKGGHLETAMAVDLVFDGRGFFELPGERYATKNTHGTGCTFASAIAANLAKGLRTLHAIQEAKAFTANAILYGLPLGAGSGPVNHLFAIVPGVLKPK